MSANQNGTRPSVWERRPGRLAGTLTVTGVLWVCVGAAQLLSLPERSPNAASGTALAQRISSLSRETREEVVVSEVLSGNVPDFWRRLCPVTVTSVTNGRMNSATFYVAPDYLAVGTDEDYFLTPLTPVAAQKIADRLDCTLPTCKMVDAIYAAAVKLIPAPIPPTAAMTTVPVFWQHNEMVRTQRLAAARQYPLGALVAGHKKDVVVTPRLATATNRVAIYGWHQTNGAPIQPLYLGHTSAWVDYSHGIRLVQQRMILNGETTTVARVLADSQLAALLSDEGVMTNAAYRATDASFSPQRGEISPNPSSRIEPQNRSRRRKEAEGLANQEIPPPYGGGYQQQVQGEGSRVRSENTNPSGEIEFTPSRHFGEQVAEFTFDPEVRIQINAPGELAPDKPVLLVFYALPNGNTIEQTIGKQLQPGDDWHFDIQHIGAQTRFLRAMLTNQTVVAAYLETEMKSWPAWRRKHGDAVLPQVVDRVRSLFSSNHVELVLTGHSGGGSFTFGYLNTQDKIPNDVARIAFLDSNYAYETTNHSVKLSEWLKFSPSPTLCVLAYHDSIALLDGKTFVSERGGTWGRSHAMLADLAAQFPFTGRTNAGLRTHAALDGRIQFLLKENPDKKILHTVQVERNGFIHALLIGTPLEGRGYEYLGERAYAGWIQPD